MRIAIEVIPLLTINICQIARIIFAILTQLQVIEKISGTVDLLTPEPMEALKLSDLNIFYTGASDCNCKTPNFSVYIN